ncbi:MAG: Fe2+-dependent dioxygenase [Sphingomonas sp.]|nr:Fe2+-dependent dioxygenase [Sphingomonas sp.]
MLEITGVLTPAEIAEVRALIAGGQWVDGRATAGPLSAAVKRNRQLDEDDPAGHHAGAIILDALARSGVFASAALAAQIAPPLFNRYAIGEAYGDHVDNGIRPLLRGRMRLDLSATLFLTPPEDYGGGELVIDGAPGVRLAAGDLLLYPAGSVHRVEPVTSGEREACFFWVQSLVRDHEARAMLFALDRAIQSLPSGAEQIVELTALYHNLLRRWSTP